MATAQDYAAVANLLVLRCHILILPPLSIHSCSTDTFSFAFFSTLCFIPLLIHFAAAYSPPKDHTEPLLPPNPRCH